MNWLREKAVDPQVLLRYKILSHVEDGGGLFHKKRKGRPSLIEKKAYHQLPKN